MIPRTLGPSVVAATKVIVSLGLLWSGFRSVSDDDFARVSIAQRFAVHPLLDPSGTSWLPLPFWVYGGAMKLFGLGLVTAQLTALLLGVYAAVGVWVIARSLELSPRAALVAALLSASFPHAAHYGAAMLPDYPTAVLGLAASATLASQRGPTRAVGAVAAMLATLCRYETWPIAAVVWLFALHDARHWSGQRRWLLASASVAPLGALGWLLNGLVNHHDALFFLRRVAAYRRALGGESLSVTARLAKQPLAMFTGEPELTLLVIALTLLLLWQLGRDGLRGQAWVRPSLAIGSMLVFLVVGDLLDGSPTHHEERTLLTAWLGLTLLAGELLDRCWDEARRRWSSPRCYAGALGSVSLVLVVAILLRSVVAKREPFVDRSREIEIGRVAAQVVPPGARLAIYTEDYGFFAVQAAFARPEDGAPLMARDPRHREQDPMSRPETLASRLDGLDARYLVVPASRLGEARSVARFLAGTSGFALVGR